MTFAELRADFERWAGANFSPAEVRSGEYDEAGYPEWQAVEDLFARHVDDASLSALSEDELCGLMFLIARSWDVGRIIAWLSNGTRFSNIAELSEHDTLFLAEASLGLAGSEYDGARQQLAKVLGRAKVARAAATALLEKLYESSDEYTKRMALLSLATLGTPNLDALVRRSWAIADEHHRMACLEVARRMRDDVLLGELLQLAATLPGVHLAKLRGECVAALDGRRGVPSDPQPR